MSGVRTTRNVALSFALAFAGAAGSEVLVPGTEPAATGGADATVDAWLACRDRQPQAESCRGLRAAAVEILAADLRTLGSGANFGPLPILLKVARGREPELRVAALEGIGMIGPRTTETAALAAAFNDPVPAVRAAARGTLWASSDPAAKALAGRAVRADRWKGLAPERAPDTSKLKIAPYAGATNLRFATDLEDGRALFVADDSPDKVVAFYNAKAKLKAMSLDEFAAAYAAPEEESSEESAGDDDSGDGGQPSADDMAKAMAQAMAMMQQMNEQTNAGKTVEEAAMDMSGAGVKADSAASEYAEEAIYGAPRVIVLEEGTAFGKTNPTRYVVVFRDLTLGKTGIALHGPPVI